MHSMSQLYKEWSIFRRNKDESKFLWRIVKISIITIPSAYNPGPQTHIKKLQKIIPLKKISLVIFNI